MKLFKKFLLDLVTDFVALVSGIASAILGAIGASRKTPLPNWTFWLAAAVCLIYASYRTWRKQHLVAETLRTTLANVTGNISVTCSAAQFDMMGGVNGYSEVILYLKIPLVIRNQRNSSTTLVLREINFALGPATLESVEVGQRTTQPRPLSIPPKRTVDIGPGQTLELMIDVRILVPNKKEWIDSSLTGTLAFEDTFAGTLAPIPFSAAPQPFNYPTVKWL